MEYETIAYEVKEKGIGILSLNRPRRYNSVNLRKILAAKPNSRPV